MTSFSPLPIWSAWSASLFFWQCHLTTEWNPSMTKISRSPLNILRLAYSSSVPMYDLYFASRNTDIAPSFPTYIMFSPNILFENYNVTSACDATSAYNFVSRTFFHRQLPQKNPWINSLCWEKKTNKKISARSATYRTSFCFRGWFAADILIPVDRIMWFLSTYIRSTCRIYRKSMQCKSQHKLLNVCCLWFCLQRVTTYVIIYSI